MEKTLTLADSHKQIKFFNRRLILAFIVIFSGIIGITARLWYLQITQNEFYSTLSAKNVVAIMPIEPTRGLIYDRNGVLLAENTPTLTLMVTPALMTNLQETFAELKKVVSLSDADIQLFQKRSWQFRPYQPQPLKNQLNEDEAARFYVNQYRFPGVSIESQTLRHYPFNHLLTSVVGYVGRINQNELKHIDNVNYSASEYIGKTGIEKQYENLLHGQVGNQQVETDANSRIMRVLNRTPSLRGNDLYLTIDVRLQQAAEEALGDDTGAVVALDPKTGEVLALVTKPSYDPNPFVTGINQADYQTLLHDPERPLYNRAIRGLYAPGSTIKPVYALKWLENGTLTQDTRVFDPGWFKIPPSPHEFHCHRRSGHGSVNLIEAITVSCDVYFYTFSLRTGINTLINALNTFGFGNKTGIDLPEELPGLVPTPAWKQQAKGHAWYAGDTVVMGIGQGYLLVTPLQLAQEVAIIANRGVRVGPHVLLNSKNVAGDVTTHSTPQQAWVTLTNPANWHTVIDGMINVIRSPQGTAAHFGKDTSYIAAGKTGTSQIFGLRGEEDGHNQSKLPRRLRDNRLFISFAPVNDPKIAVAVIIEHSSNSDAVARKVIDYYLNNILASKTSA